MHPIVNIAVNAARQAGKLILRAQDQLENLQIIEKGRNDFASQVDKAAEEIIIDTIKKAYPQHTILGEETGLTQGQGQGMDATWIIDPLDGTTNFLHGFPQFCISIAFKYQDKIMHGVVYDPVRDELFSASRGEGARMNGKRLRVSSADRLQKALLGTGFPFRDFSYLDQYLTFLKAIIPHCAGIRRAGAAALDLAYVAAGRLDGFWEFGLKPWDIAAGSLFIQEAGGFISTVTGDQNFLNGSSILAAPPKIYQEMMELCKKFF
ncbi:MAG: inositol monophosphatase [Gammaproteobacteria bacterium 39-13]|nr:inositol monophosphatase [Gammaproteobacteria bacterium]OJV86937.1 MAG: inositol monophosphatase [Gammaproteobacteria bacterium 39-13]